MKLAVLAVLAATATAAAGPLTVEVTPATATWKVGTPVKITVRVVNTSSAKQSFDVFNCSYADSFASIDPALSVIGVPCDENTPTRTELAPGKAWEAPLDMRATRDGKHALQLKFTPHGAKAPAATSSSVAITVVK